MPTKATRKRVAFCFFFIPIPFKRGGVEPRPCGWPGEWPGAAMNFKGTKIEKSRQPAFVGESQTRNTCMAKEGRGSSKAACAVRPVCSKGEKESAHRW
jgi:hypothetical protein